MSSNLKSAASTSPKLLTMDTIELTLLLKSIGFRLESIDFNEHRFSGGKMLDNTNTIPSPTKVNDANFIHVEISCSKSKIISRLSYKFNDDGANAAAPSTCTCPPKTIVDNNNSFWEIQTTGTFTNQRRSLNGLMKQSENGIDNDTSSNLLPALSDKSISLTQLLAQVILNQYKNDIEFGEMGLAKCTDIKSILKAFQGSARAVEQMGAAEVAKIKPEDLNLITPISSMNVTPTDINMENAETSSQVPDICLNGLPPIRPEPRNMALEDTVNTEAFTSPKSDLFTSSPNADEQNNNCTPNVERDANIIHNLNQARHFVDATLLLMKLNVTRNMSHDLSTLLTVTPRLPNDKNGTRFSMPASVPRGGALVSRNSSKMTDPRILNAATLTANRNRKLPAIAKVDSLTTLRSNSTASSIGRPIISKPAPVRRAVVSIANRTIGGNLSLSVRTPTVPNLKPRLSYGNISTTIKRNSGTVLNATSLGTTSVAPALVAGRRASIANGKPTVQSKLATATKK